MRRTRRLLVARVDGRGLWRRAAVRADPEDPAAIAAAIEIARDRRDELVSRGVAHAARFSWNHTGRVFLDCYLEAV